MELAQLYITAFGWVHTYVHTIMQHLVGVRELTATGWLDFFYLGATDLATMLTSYITIIVFVLVHVGMFKLFKYLFNLFRGVVRVW